MHPRKVNNVIKLDAEDRYWYTIREIVKLGEIWAVSNPDSWVTFVDEAGDEIFPIWPHKEVAEICAWEDLKVANYEIEAMDYVKFKELCIPDMIQEKIYFGVFYNRKKEAFAVPGHELLEHLEEEQEGN